ncbi:hypothetical protein GC174_10155 [bacterium]|nr:hypothetical protein [bacterium]
MRNIILLIAAIAAGFALTFAPAAGDETDKKSSSPKGILTKPPGVLLLNQKAPRYNQPPEVQKLIKQGFLHYGNEPREPGSVTSPTSTSSNAGVGGTTTTQGKASGKPVTGANAPANSNSPGLQPIPPDMIIGSWSQAGNTYIVQKQGNGYRAVNAANNNNTQEVIDFGPGAPSVDKTWNCAVTNYTGTFRRVDNYGRQPRSTTRPWSASFHRNKDGSTWLMFGGTTAQKM